MNAMHKERAATVGLVSTLPAWLGGDLSGWKIGLLALVVACYGCLYPLQWEGLRGRKGWALLAIAFWMLLGFLPFALAGVWHADLTHAGLEPGVFRHPQAWVLLEQLFLAGLLGGWMLCLFGQKWSSSEISSALRFALASVVVLGGWAVWMRLDGGRCTWWDVQGGLGPFPNRNQSGNLFGLAGVMALALGAHELRNRRFMAYIWVTASLFLLGCAVWNGSRAGVLLFLVGVLIWSAWQWSLARKKSHAAVLFSAALLMLSLFLFFGGSALDRWVGTVESSSSGLIEATGRSEVWKDTLGLMSTYPMTGVGAGNFSEMFALERTVLLKEARVLHPENDYLWWASEHGLIGLVLLFWVIVEWLLPYLGSHKGSGRRLRSAAFLVTLLFLAHGLVDVSGHRWGTLWMVLLYVRLSWPVQRTSFPSPGATVAEPAWRRFGWSGFCLALTAWFLLPWSTGLYLPNSTWVDEVKKSWGNRMTDEPQRAAIAVDQAVRVSPLDWELHYMQGVARLRTDHGSEGAWHSFRVARALEPTYSLLPYEEGRLWLHEGDLARTWRVWKEALDRRTVDEGGLFAEMMRAASNKPELREVLLFMASRREDLRFAVLEQLPDEDFTRLRTAHINRLRVDLVEDRRFMRRLLTSWDSRGGREEVLDFLHQRPEWLSAGWGVRVASFVATGHHAEAYHFMKERLPAPVMPDLSDDEGVRVERLRRLRLGQADPVVLYSWLKYDSEEFSMDFGMEMIRKTLAAPNSPLYLDYMAAEYGARHQKWAEAVQWMERYGRRVDAAMDSAGASK